VLSDTLWHLEAVKTRAALLASQRKYWFRWAVSAWFFCTVAAFVFSLSAPEQKKNAMPWILASVVQEVKPDVGVKWQGKYYDAYILAPYLTRVFYGDTLWSWLGWAGGCGLLAVTLIGTGGYWYIRNKKGMAVHIRGAEVIQVEELRSRLSKAGPGMIAIAGVPIPTEIERQHTIICGATGSGKSQTIMDILTQAEDSEIPCIVVDPGGDLTAKYYDPERGDWILNPLHQSCPSWRPEYEGESEAEVAAQAASWFPIVPGTSSTTAYYNQQGQINYANLLLHARGVPVWEIPDLLTEEARRKGSRFGGPQVMTTMQNALRSLQFLRPGERDWSAREWVATPRGWCFLSFRKRDKAAVLPLISFWFESLVRELLSTETISGIRVRIVIDEMAALGPVPTLAELTNEGRKYGVPVTMGFQDVNQIEAIYGPSFTKNLLNMPRTRLLLASNDAATQQWCADNIGEREMQRPSETERIGSQDVSDSITRSFPIRTEPAVMAAEFDGLPDLTGYLKIRPYGVAKVNIPYVKRENRHPVFLARKSHQGGGVEPPDVEPVVSKERRAV